MLIEKVRTDLYQATKARELPRVRAWRMLISSLEYLEKRGSQVTTEDEMAAVKLEIKKRKEAIEAFGQVGEHLPVADLERQFSILQQADVRAYRRPHLQREPGFRADAVPHPEGPVVVIAGESKSAG